MVGVSEGAGRRSGDASPLSVSFGFLVLFTTWRAGVYEGAGNRSGDASPLSLSLGNWMEDMFFFGGTGKWLEDVSFCAAVGNWLEEAPMANCYQFLSH